MNNNNPIKNLQSRLDATLEKKSELIGKRLRKWNTNQDYIYKVIAVVFWLLLAYEGAMWLWSHYTLQRAIILFVIISLVYFFLKTYSKNSFASRAISFLKKYKDQFVYGSFIAYFLIFLATFIFKVSDIFVYASYAMIAVYAFFKTLWFHIDYTLPKTKMSNSLFLRGMIISMSIFLVVCHYILSAYKVTIPTKLLYLWVWVLYIVLFVVFFWEWSLKDIRWYLKSRRFKRFVASNTYNILSLLVIFFTVTGLAYKFGYFDNIFKKAPTEIVIETPTEEVPEVQVVEPEKPTTQIVVKKISEVYQFNNRLEVWSEWEDVSRLQGFLSSMKYLESEPTWVFDEETRVALRNTLREKCDWPETTKWILGTQAMACINNLEVQVVEDIPEDELTEEESDTSSEEIVVEESEQESVPVVEEVSPGEPETKTQNQETETIENQPTQPEVVQPEPIEAEIVEQEAPTQEEPVEQQAQVEEVRINRVSDLYIFTETIQAWNTWNQVRNLHDIMTVLWYYNGPIDNEFDEETRIALRNTLIAKCNWPQTTKWILGPQARSCINTIPLPKQ